MGIQEFKWNNEGSVFNLYTLFFFCAEFEWASYSNYLLTFQATNNFFNFYLNGVLDWILINISVNYFIVQVDLPSKVDSIKILSADLVRYLDKFVDKRLIWIFILKVNVYGWTDILNYCIDFWENRSIYSSLLKWCALMNQNFLSIICPYLIRFTGYVCTSSYS